LVRLAHRAGTRDFCPAMAALVGLVQNIFFLAAHYFKVLNLPPSPTKQGSQSCRRLSLINSSFTMELGMAGRENSIQTAPHCITIPVPMTTIDIPPQIFQKRKKVTGAILTYI
jgi:hypothetical protein